MGVLGNNAIIGASAAGAYEIERSLRYNASDGTYLTRTPGTSTYTKGTYSFWAKKTSTGKISSVIQAGRDGSNNNQAQVAFWNDDCLQIYSYHSSAYKLNLKTNAHYKDTAWYHVVFAWDTTQGTNTNRAKLYVNGEQVTSFSTATYPNQNEVMMFDNPNASASGVNRIGAYWNTNHVTAHNYDGYLSDLHYVDGTQLAASDFGQTDPSTGAWIPIKYIGTYGTNGYYLKFNDNSGTTATTLGKDSSGNGNNWTPNNFSVATGPGNDSVVDTPSNNYCVLDILDKKDCIITDGALSTATTAGGGHQPGFSTFGLTSGKWYVEGGKIGSNGTTVCVWPKEHDFHSLTQDHAVHNNAGNQNAKGYGFNLQYGSATHTPSHTVSSYTGTSFTTWMLALDLDNGKIWWGVDGTWGNNGGVGNPATGANPAYSTGFAGEVWSVGSMTTSGNNLSFNFGQQGFAYTPPDGFKPICTANLPEPTIKKGSDYFNTLLWTGTGSDNTITDVGFQPDLAWIKNRSHGGCWHDLYDSIRGATKRLFPNNNEPEQTQTEGLKSFSSGGYTLGSNNDVNANGNDYVGWNWKESATAGFDMTTYTGNALVGGGGPNNQTISHSLGVVPELILHKAKTAPYSGGGHWITYHKDLTTPTHNFLKLNTADGTITSSNAVFNQTAPTSSVFSVGLEYDTNKENIQYMAYLWSSVDGYSKVGKYPGNQDNNGPFVFTGFRPSFVMLKATNGNNWATFDSKRDPENGMDERLHPNLDNTTNTGAGKTIDFLSNGFKIRTTDGLENPSSAWVVYLAIAETSYKYSNAR